RGARKRLLALAELIRLQMRAEKEKVTTVEDITEDGSPFLSPALERGYTTDGVAFFDTLAAMNYSLEEDRAKLELAKANGFSTHQQDAPPKPKPPKPRSAAKEKVIRAIEATAEAEERGVYRDHRAAGRKKHVHVVDALGVGGGEEEGPCCEKHAFQLERSAAHRLEERVKE
ncbi:unnamed protein product, partial [Ectocarpus sp. 12 AP-2014]